MTKRLPKPVHDHVYWAAEVSKFNTQKEREDFLKGYGFEDKRIEVITHLCVYWLPKRMYQLSNRLLNAAYKDLPNNTTRTMFKIGIHNLRNKR